MTEFDDLIAHAEWLRALAERLARPAADDLVQETWVAALRSPVRIERSARGWLARVLTNVIRMDARADGRRRAREADPTLEAPEVPATDLLLERLELQQALAAELAQLEEPFRTVVLLRFFEGRSSAEIARSLRVPAGTVRWRLKEGLDRLRARMDRRYGARAAWVLIALPLPDAGATGAGGLRGAKLLAAGALGAAVVATVAVSWRVERPLTVAPQAARSSGANSREAPWRAPAAWVPQAGADLPPQRAPAPTAVALLSGHVRDELGAAIAGATVTAATWRPPADDRPSTLSTTDASGAFALSLAPDVYLITVAAPGRVPVRERVAVSRARSWDVRLQPGARIDGQVLEEGSRAAVTAQLHLRSMSGAEHHGEAGVDGRFVFGELEPGGYQLVARTGEQAGMSQPIWVGRGERTTTELFVRRQRTVRGRVLLPDGTAAVGADVLLARENRPPELVARAVTDADGVFVLGGIFAGNHVLSVVGGAGHAEPRRVRVLDADVTDADVRLEDGALVGGRVLDPRGEGVAGAEVEALVHVGGEGRPARFTAHTTSRGEWSLPPLPSGRLSVWARAAAGIAVAESAVVRAGEHRELTLALVPPRTVGGVVRGPDGVPAADVIVMASALGRGPLAVGATDPSGEFVLPALPAGRLQLSTIPRSALYAVDVDGVGARAVTLELRDHAITGRVVDSRGQPVAGALVRGGEERGRSIGAGVGYTDDQGRFRVAASDVEPRVLTAFAAGHGEARVQLRAGESDVSIALAPEGRLAGVVVTRAGIPVADYVLTLRPAAPALPVRDGQIVRVSDPGGAFSMRHLRAGVFNLRAVTAAGATGGAVVVVHAGDAREDVRIVLDEDVDVVGRAIDADSREPIAGAGVRAWIGGRTVRATADAEGRFRLAGVLPGEAVALTVAGDRHLHVREDARVRVPAQAVGTHDLGDIRLIRSQRSDTDRRANTARLGLDAVSDDGRLMVAAVDPGGPAEQAGVRVGDRLLALDGVAVADLGAGAFAHRALGRPGTTVALAVERAGSGVRTVTILRSEARRRRGPAARP